MGHPELSDSRVRRKETLGFLLIVMSAVYLNCVHARMPFFQIQNTHTRTYMHAHDDLKGFALSHADAGTAARIHGPLRGITCCRANIFMIAGGAGDRVLWLTPGAAYFILAQAGKRAQWDVVHCLDQGDVAIFQGCTPVGLEFMESGR